MDGVITRAAIYGVIARACANGVVVGAVQRIICVNQITFRIQRIGGINQVGTRSAFYNVVEWGRGDSCDRRKTRVGVAGVIGNRIGERLTAQITVCNNRQRVIRVQCNLLTRGERNCLAHNNRCAVNLGNRQAAV